MKYVIFKRHISLSYCHIKMFSFVTEFIFVICCNDICLSPFYDVASKHSIGIDTVNDR